VPENAFIKFRSTRVFVTINETNYKVAQNCEKSEIEKKRKQE